jgi:ABC-2 type transport system permease protein
MSTVAKTIRFITGYWRVNWQGAMEFRASFWTQMITMLINNGVWIAFWGIFFNRFPVVKGWEFTDVLLLWGITAGAFGWLHILFGNVGRVAYLIANGQIDSYLTMPKNILLHMLISRMSFSAWGDVLFAWLLFFIAIPFRIDHLLIYIMAQMLGGVLMGAVILAGQSLAFWIGNSEGLSFQIANAMITFTTYPIDIFQGFTRLLLFTLLPAGFISIMPIALFRGLHLSFLVMLISVTILFAASSVFIFYRGLRRYESGNMITLKM